MALNMNEITFKVLEGAGIATHRARDLMSALVLLRIDGALYTGNFSGPSPSLYVDRDTLDIDIQCDIEALASAAQPLAPSWGDCSAPEVRTVRLQNGSETTVFFVRWRIKF